MFRHEDSHRRRRRSHRRVHGRSARLGVADRPDQQRLHAGRTRAVIRRRPDFAGCRAFQAAPGTLHQRIALFPITGGRLDASNAKGEVPHSGGLKLTSATTQVIISDFVIDTTASPKLTGDRHGQRVDRRPHPPVQPRAAAAVAAAHPAARPRATADRGQPRHAHRGSRDGAQRRLRRHRVHARLQHRHRLGVRQLLSIAGVPVGGGQVSRRPV